MRGGATAERGTIGRTDVPAALAAPKKNKKHRSSPSSAKKQSNRKNERSNASNKSSSSSSSDDRADKKYDDPFALLAQALQSQLATALFDKEREGVTAGTEENLPFPDLERITSAFHALARAQQAFKGLDGAAHEAYQRTHSSTSSSSSSSSSEIDTAAGLDGSVAGRATRSAARAGAVADGLGACELCELVEFPQTFRDATTAVDVVENDGPLVGRTVLLNQTNAVALGDTASLDVLLLFEPNYQGGAGLEHGGVAPVEALPISKRAQGRLVVVLGDSACRSLAETVELLLPTPLHVRLGDAGGAALSEAASVPPILYRAAASLLHLLEEPLRVHNASAVHFVGRSLAGGVASLAATMFHGSLVLPKNKKAKKVRIPAKSLPTTGTVLRNATNAINSTSAAPAPAPVPLQGLGAGRTSALTLGAPPCLSPNVPADFVTSLVYGDDLVCRASHDALQRLLERTHKGIRTGGNGWVSSVGRPVGWVTDALSMAAFNLKSHARGSEGEEARLAVPGRAYLVHPRRRGGGGGSIHEIGGQLKGGREALRAAVLWQLNDILLSKSMWKHHQLESYIHGLDKVHLRGLDEA